jgi:hypothetical protein
LAILTCEKGRKRKIRCIYDPSKQNTCKACFSRGVDCISQDKAQSAVVSKKKQNLRERVSQLEIMITAMGDQLEENRRLLEALTASESMKSARLPTNLVIHDPNSKEFQMCQALTSLFPNGALPESLLSKADVIWRYQQQEEARLFDRWPQFDSFKKFSAQMLHQGSAFDVAEVAHVLASVPNNAIADRLLLLVDRFIIADQECMKSLKGLQCALRQGFAYSNSGQMSQAWHAFRRAIVFAQAQGLHRQRKNTESENAWWALFSLDRSFSLILAVPYAIADDRCNMKFNGGDLDQDTTTDGFILRLSRISGKVIDHLQSHVSSTVQEIGEELSRLALEIPTSITSAPEIIHQLGHVSTAVGARQVIHCALTLHQTDIALHLPYMLKFPRNVLFEPFRDRCVQASRKFLCMYHQFRHPSNTYAAYCRMYDHVACTAAVVLLLGIWGYGKPEESSQNHRDDWRLVEASMELLKRTSANAGERVAAQSYRALEQVKESQSLDTTKVVFPYFGKSSISRREILHMKDTTTSLAEGGTLSSFFAFPEPQANEIGQQLLESVNPESGASQLSLDTFGQLVAWTDVLEDGSEVWGIQPHENNVPWNQHIENMEIQGIFNG